MDNYDINWDSVPDPITKEQFYRLCHISKATARYLLMNGFVPCKFTGKKSRCFKIRKADVMEYLELREKYPEKYVLPSGWRKGNGANNSKLRVKMMPVIHEDMHGYYTELFFSAKDVLTIREVEELTAYDHRTIARWCSQGLVKNFMKSGKIHIPKQFLIDYLCSTQSMRGSKRSDWHESAMRGFDAWKREHT